MEEGGRAERRRTEPTTETFQLPLMLISTLLRTRFTLPITNNLPLVASLLIQEVIRRYFKRAEEVKPCVLYFVDLGGMVGNR